MRGYRHEWRQERAREVLTKACKLKFSQSVSLHEHLLRTKEVLAEANPFDVFFGIGIGMFEEQVTDERRWRGQNVMGQVLMDVRSSLKDKSGEKNSKEVKKEEAGKEEGR